MAVGRIDKREEELSFVVEKINLFDDSVLEDYEKKMNLEIYVPKNSDISVLQAVNRTLRGYPGKVAVTLLLPNGGQMKRMNLPFSVDPNSMLEGEIKKILGDGSFKKV